MTGQRSQPNTSVSAFTELNSSKTTRSSTVASPGVIKPGPKAYRFPKHENKGEKSMRKLVEILLAVPKSLVAFFVSLCMSLKSVFELTADTGLNEARRTKAIDAEEEVHQRETTQMRRFKKAMTKPKTKERTGSDKSVEVEKQVRADEETQDNADSQKKKRRRPKKPRKGGQAEQQKDTVDVEIRDAVSGRPMEATGATEDNGVDEGWTTALSKKGKRALKKQAALVQAEGQEPEPEPKDDSDSDMEEGTEDDSDEDPDCSDYLGGSDGWSEVKYKALERCASAPSLAVQVAPEMDSEGFKEEVVTEVTEIKPAEKDWKPASGVFWSEMDDEDGSKSIVQLI